MHRLLLLALLVFSLPLPAELANQLRNHPSPYLAMHGDDPVHWQSWGEEVLTRARAEHKLLFISSGYFACHWCHVMQRESYRNSEVAALINQHFIAVKVDRELEPALDGHLIDFVQRTRGSAGWPLNVFLTPEGYPLVGLTYAPTESFMALLVRLQQLWQEQAAELSATARSAALAMASERAVALPDRIDVNALHSSLVSTALKIGDDIEGGFGRQNRFPMAPQWSVLLARLATAPNEQLRELIELTLEQMAHKGLRDHIGGGFFRYTVDPGWQIPHYEKMLYSQALLARLYLAAARQLQLPAYLEVARDTLDFALTGLSGTGGGFIAGLSAVDSDNSEGGGYLWSDEQLAQALTDEELEFARKRWRLAGDPITEGGWLPVDAIGTDVLAGSAGVASAVMLALEQRIKHKLLIARAARNHPRDEKQLAAWNGLMLSALVEGAKELGEKRYRDAAERLRDFLVTRLWDGERLLRARSDTGELGSAALEDYVYVATGLRDWGKLNGSEADLVLAGQLAAEAWRRFYRPEGWQVTDKLLLPGIALERAINDGPLPSPAAMLIEFSITSGDPELMARVPQAVFGGYPLAREQPIAYATQVAACIAAADLLQSE
ncbi:MAG: thioredoxin domain-containing protein [Gammaproteobacteria bacterium]|nr:thioredoxin domain-containing protein [Gammaproteobacteria bacterium]